MDYKGLSAKMERDREGTLAEMKSKLKLSR